MPETQYKKLLSCHKKEKYEVAINHGKMSESALQCIAKSLSENDVWVRMFMAETIGIIRDEEAILNFVPLKKYP